MTTELITSVKRTFNTNVFTELVEEPEKYQHPFSDEDVTAIKERYKKLAANNFVGITLEDQKLTIIPHLVIHRTEVFRIKAEKEKAVKASKEVKVRKEKEVKGERIVKEKKLTKKQYQDKLLGIIMQMAQGLVLNDEDKAFYDNHLSNEGGI